MVGNLLEATDIGANISTYCALSSSLPSCIVELSTYAYTIPAGQSVRIDWTCICGVGNDPTVDPTTGACTPCVAGAAPAQKRGSVRTRSRVWVGSNAGVKVMDRQRPGEGSGSGSGWIARVGEGAGL